MTQQNDNSYPTKKWTDSGIIWGKLEVFPTNKGYKTYIEGGEIGWLFDRFHGKEVLITITELSEDSTYDSSPTTKTEVEE